MDINLISKHRKSLMAIAMIIIALYHAYFPINLKIYSFFISTNGHMAVDLFLFLSSFGLYYAYKKESNYWKFEKRRLLRILPYSIPFSFALIFIRGISFKEAVIHSLGLSCFLCNDLTCWFTSLILFLYLVTPLYLKVFNKKPLCVTLIGFVMIYLMCLSQTDSWEFSYKFCRIGSYIWGFYFAYLNDCKVNLGFYHKLIIMLFMVFGWAATYCLYHYTVNDVIHVLGFPFTVPGTLMIFSYLIDKLSIIQKPLEYIGNYTFQFYLLHIEIHRHIYSHYSDIHIQLKHYDVWINLVGIIVAFILSVLIKKIIEYLLKHIQRMTSLKE